jgi:hypothetical protein
MPRRSEVNHVYRSQPASLWCCDSITRGELWSSFFLSSPLCFCIYLVSVMALCIFFCLSCLFFVCFSLSIFSHK